MFQTTNQDLLQDEDIWQIWSFIGDYWLKYRKISSFQPKSSRPDFFGLIPPKFFGSEDGVYPLGIWRRCGKSPCLMGKSTFLWWFSIAMWQIPRGYLKIHWFIMGFPEKKTAIGPVAPSKTTTRRSVTSVVFEGALLLRVREEICVTHGNQWLIWDKYRSY